MGKTFCAKVNHPWLHQRDVETCWRCDRCPKQEGFRLGRGSYCPDCTVALKGEGMVWSEYYQNYVNKEALIHAEIAQCQTCQKLEEHGANGYCLVHTGKIENQKLEVAV